MKVVTALTPEKAVPILDLRERLSIFKRDRGPSYRTGFVRGAPSKCKQADGEDEEQAAAALAALVESGFSE